MKAINMSFMGGVRNLYHKLTQLADKIRGVDFHIDDYTTKEVEGHHIYQATTSIVLRMLKKYVKANIVDGDSLLDVGCGKGKMVWFFKKYFRKCDGLEYSEQLVSIARKNMKKLKVDAEIYCGDAANFTKYGDYNWFYMFNPFGEEILEKFLTIMNEATVGKKVRVIYFNLDDSKKAVFKEHGFDVDEYIGHTIYALSRK